MNQLTDSEGNHKECPCCRAHPHREPCCDSCKAARAANGEMWAMTQLSEEQQVRVKQIRERWRVKVSNTKSWGERPTLQSVGGMEGAMADIDYLLSLYDSRATCGQLQDDDELVAEMNTVSENLVSEWYRQSQHRDDLVDEIAVTLTAAHRRAEAFKEARRKVYMIPGSISVDPAVRKGFAAGVNAAIEVIAALEAAENRKGEG